MTFRVNRIGPSSKIIIFPDRAALLIYLESGDSKPKLYKVQSNKETSREKILNICGYRL